MDTIIVNDISDTKALCQKFAKLLVGGELILLDGQLGAGKTTFVRFLLQALGVKETISSPTFTIMKEYKLKKFDIFHFDMYRISNASEGAEFGLDEYIFDRKRNIVLIEWSSNIREILPKNVIKINITIIDENKRKIEIER